MGALSAFPDVKLFVYKTLAIMFCYVSVKVESLSRDLLVVNQVQQQQQLVEANRKKTAMSEQYEMMCRTYRRERDGT